MSVGEIEEAQSEKTTLENVILESIKEFESKYGLEVEEIKLMRGDCSKFGDTRRITLPIHVDLEVRI